MLKPLQGKVVQGLKDTVWCSSSTPFNRTAPSPLSDVSIYKPNGKEKSGEWSRKHVPFILGTSTMGLSSITSITSLFSSLFWTTLLLCSREWYGNLCFLGQGEICSHLITVCHCCLQSNRDCLPPLFNKTNVVKSAVCYPFAIHYNWLPHLSAWYWTFLATWWLILSQWCEINTHKHKLTLLGTP